jgi:hypothetical protein
MENINKEIEKQLGEFDYLFQEGVVIPKKDMDRFDELMEKFASIRSEIHKHPSGNYVNDMF